MTPEQQEFWDTLRDDPVMFAHKSGTEMYLVVQKAKQSKKGTPPKFHKLADKYMWRLLATNDLVRIIKTVATWLQDYALPFQPGKMESFERFHQTVGHIVGSGTSITGYKL